MQHYQFVIKDNSHKAYRLFFLFLFFLNIAAAAILVLFSTSKWLTNIGFGTIGIFLAVIILYYFFKKKQHAFIAYQLFLSLIFCIFWLMQSGVIAMLFCMLVLGLTYVLQTKKTSIIFCDEAIILKHIFTPKHFLWTAVAHIILKDNILTIDFKSNKIIQVEVVGITPFYEVGFNAFVMDKIKSVY